MSVGNVCARVAQNTPTGYHGDSNVTSVTGWKEVETSLHFDRVPKPFLPWTHFLQLSSAPPNTNWCSTQIHTYYRFKNIATGTKLNSVKAYSEWRYSATHSYQMHWHLHNGQYHALIVSLQRKPPVANGQDHVEIIILASAGRWTPYLPVRSS